ncbi:hypothetical protein JI59_24100 (plasmid) [Novosphingobium pentaromativorans US6-1]|nr:hypothetical protein JI59_24100 [Novosphingobium pentaromativorans US6-1]KKC26850.1 hypothetical protein WP12_06505 [Sphingomonas sp. SRS2]
MQIGAWIEAHKLVATQGCRSRSEGGKARPTFRPPVEPVAPRPRTRASDGALARLLGRTAEERSGEEEFGSDTVFETSFQETFP